MSSCPYPTPAWSHPGSNAPPPHHRRQPHWLRSRRVPSRSSINRVGSRHSLHELPVCVAWCFTATCKPPPPPTPPHPLVTICSRIHKDRRCSWRSTCAAEPVGVRTNESTTVVPLAPVARQKLPVGTEEYGGLRSHVIHSRVGLRHYFTLLRNSNSARKGAIHWGKTDTRQRSEVDVPGVVSCRFPHGTWVPTP